MIKFIKSNQFLTQNNKSQFIKKYEMSCKNFTNSNLTWLNISFDVYKSG